jgi:ABC-type uncharacterized transport system substrate-binding protein
MRRRDFLGLVGGAAANLPAAVRAQQRGAPRRVGILLPASADDLEFQARLTAFLQKLHELGWTSDATVRIDTRWATTNTESIGTHAAELVALAPNVIFAHGATTVGPLLKTTRAVPIVFAIVADPVGSGYVASLARPGGNATGFMVFEPSVSGKWLELLKQLAPRVTRVAVLRDLANPTATLHFGVLRASSAALGLEVTPIDMQDRADFERAIAAFVLSPNGGLVVTSSGLAQRYRRLIVSLAARNNLPAVYFERSFVADGGLASYGPDFVYQYGQAATYVDRVLKGEKPAQLPVQTPTKYQTILNLKTAAAIGITVPNSMQLLADEVIE